MLAFALAALAAPTISNDLTASQLESACRGRGAAASELCRTYLIGGVNAMTDPNSSFRRICTPATANLDAFKVTYSDYLQKHPSEATRPAVIVILEALEQAYSCAS